MTWNDLTEDGRAIDRRAQYAFWTRGIEQGIKALETELRDAGDLPLPEQRYFEKYLKMWKDAVNPDYIPPPLSVPDNALPLFLKHYYFGRKGEFGKAFASAWAYMQYCPAGTTALLGALDTLADIASRLDDVNLVRCVVEMWLCQYSLMMAAAKYTDQDAASQVGADNRTLWSEDLYIPWQAALNYIGQDPAPCWARILQLEAEMATPERRNEPYYEKVVAALRQHHQTALSLIVESDSDTRR